MRAESLVREFWAELRHYGHASFEPKADGLPSQRLRKALFPLVFSDAHVSAAMIEANGRITPEQKLQAKADFRAARAALEDAGDRYRELTGAYRAMARAEGDYFLGRESQYQLFREAFHVAQLTPPGDDAGNRLAIAAQVIHGLRTRWEKLTAADLDQAIRSGRIDLEARLAEAWIEPVAVNRPKRRSPNVENQLRDLTHVLDIARGDRPVLTDGPRADRLWRALVDSDELGRSYSPRELGLTLFDPAPMPELTGHGRRSISTAGGRQRHAALLDQSIKGRITRFLGGEFVEVHTAAEIALNRAIRASSQPFGLGRPESRVTLALAKELSDSLADRPREVSSGHLAVSAQWRRFGWAGGVLRNPSPLFDRARAFVEAPHDYFVARVWVRLFRQEIEGNPVDGPLSAWQEIIGALVSTRKHIKAECPPPAQQGPPTIPTPPPPRPPGGTDWIDEILSFGTQEPRAQLAYLTRVARYESPSDRGYAQDEKLWVEWCGDYAAVPVEDSADLVTVDDLPSFRHLIDHLRRTLRRDPEVGQ